MLLVCLKKKNNNPCITYRTSVSSDNINPWVLESGCRLCMDGLENVQLRTITYQSLYCPIERYSQNDIIILKVRNLKHYKLYDDKLHTTSNKENFTTSKQVYFYPYVFIHVGRRHQQYPEMLLPYFGNSNNLILQKSNTNQHLIITFCKVR